MKTRTTALLATLISTLTLGLATDVYARGDHDGWRDAPRYEHRWEDRDHGGHHDRGRHAGWDHHRHDDWRFGPVFVYSTPAYPAPVYYETRTYRYPSSPSVIIDLPTIVFR